MVVKRSEEHLSTYTLPLLANGSTHNTCIKLHIDTIGRSLPAVPE